MLKTNFKDSNNTQPISSKAKPVNMCAVYHYTYDNKMLTTATELITGHISRYIRAELASVRLNQVMVKNRNCLCECGGRREGK